MDWLDECPDGWTLRYLAGLPLWLAVLTVAALAMMQSIYGAAPRIAPGRLRLGDRRRGKG